MSEVTVAELEQQLSDSKVIAARREMARRLSKNTDFRKLILEEYLVNEAARMVQLSGDPNLDKEGRKLAIAMAQATGHFKRYLSVLDQMADLAERNIPDIEANIEELRSMGADD